MSELVRHPPPVLRWADDGARASAVSTGHPKAVPDAAPEDVFAMMIRQLVDAGLIEIDEYRLPDSTAMRESVGDA